MTRADLWRLMAVIVIGALTVRGAIAVFYDDLPGLFPNFHGVLFHLGWRV